MPIQVKELSKRYNQQWIFKNINLNINDGDKIAILGINGSGKSTLLKTLTGHTAPSSGTVMYTVNQQQVSNQEIYKYIGFTSPALELPEEFTLLEFLNFHFKFKSAVCTTQEAIDYIGLNQAATKKIGYFSSGMKQRVKLIQAMALQAPYLFLDEPCSNLDDNGINLYLQMIQQLAINKTIIVSSNVAQEYEFCNQFIQLKDYL
jgi:ABC-type multidrug transport system ATPase subunit